VKVEEMISMLSRLGRDTEISSEELQALLPHGEARDGDFYLPEIEKNFYVPSGMQSLTDPRHLRRL